MVLGESGYYPYGSNFFTGESISVDQVLFVPNLSNWSASYSGSIAGGGSPTETVTLATCPAGFYAAIPNQLLWISGTSAGINTTVWGYGEFAVTTGGTCAPGVSNGTISLQNVSFQPTNFAAHGSGGTISNGVGPYLEDNISLNGRMTDVRIAHQSGGYQGNGIQIDSDQAAVISNFNDDTSNGGVRSDIDFQGAPIFSPGPDSLYGAIAYITGSNIAGGGYSINWLSGNDLVATGNIFQDASVAFIRLGTKRGGFGTFRIRDNHFEGSGNAPWGVPVGVPDMIQLGGLSPLMATGNIGRGAPVGGNNSAAFPLYLNVGGSTATQYYYLAAHNNSITAPANCTTGGDCITVPTPIGCAQVTDPSANNVPVQFLGWGVGEYVAPDTGISSYDLLAVSSNQTVCGILPPAPPSGTGNFAVATGVTPGSICDIHDLCTITDNVAPGSRASYTVTGYPTPGKSWAALDMFGEGEVYLGPNTDTSIGSLGVLRRHLLGTSDLHQFA